MEYYRTRLICWTNGPLLLAPTHSTFNFIVPYVFFQQQQSTFQLAPSQQNQLRRKSLSDSHLPQIGLEKNLVSQSQEAKSTTNLNSDDEVNYKTYIH